MSLEESGNGLVMPVSPMYSGNSGFGGGFGGDGWWILLLFILLGNGGFGNDFGGYGSDIYPWMNQSNQINGGFRDQMLNSSITGIQNSIISGFGDVQNSLCSGFAGVNASVNGAQNAIAQQLYTNQISDLERSFASQTAQTAGMNAIASNLQNCCCENRANITDLKYTIATENCADRSAINDGVRDILANQNAGIQRILDTMCQDKIDAKNDTIAQLRSELMYARGQASQDVQTAAIQAGQRALANEVEQYVLPTPRPAYIVQNPNCCNQFTGCGCTA
jgi:hypothetical protein